MMGVGLGEEGGRGWRQEVTLLLLSLPSAEPALFPSL